jgi:hypothetical protein
MLEREKKNSVYRFVKSTENEGGEVIRVSETFKIYGPDKFESNLAPLGRKKEKPLFTKKLSTVFST